MVCPNCHSDRIIAVQDQHFCINCGQQVPNPETGRAKPSVAVGADGLPEGVKILPITPGAKTAPSPLTAALITHETSQPPAETPKSPAKTGTGSTPIIKQRSRITIEAGDAPGDDTKANDPAAPPSARPEPAPTTKAKKRKPGRPKAGRLDAPAPSVTSTPTPNISATTAPSATETISATTAPTATAAAKPPLGGPRRLSDIAPRHPSRGRSHTTPVAAGGPEIAATTTAKTEAAKPLPQSKSQPKPAKPSVHKVGVPPLHYGHILGASLRARAKGRWLFLGSLAAATFAVVIGYFAWIFLTGGLPSLAVTLMHATPALIGEVGLLAVLYYIGRSVGQGAIIYGLTREADARPVPLSHQISVGINTFGRRFTLDLLVGAAELVLIVAGAKLLVEGGSWNLPVQLQIGLLFAGFLGILYLLTGLALTRGLAGVAITITVQPPLAAAKLGWRLFSHRLELVALRFLTGTLELLLAVPLAALALALILTVPAAWHIPVAITVGLLAWLAGALFGAGTAAWWTALYRRLVKVEQPNDAPRLLTGYNTESPQPGSLTAVVAVSSFLIAAALALPWLKFF
jgi:hypothetical protein